MTDSAPEKVENQRRPLNGPVRAHFFQVTKFNKFEPKMTAWRKMKGAKAYQEDSVQRFFYPCLQVHYGPVLEFLFLENDIMKN